ncbi:superoxide dismutase [Xylogone sp. PMI_703]|nr:superoxide dismutase [Xylogone sp. PMI_703]
MAFNLPSLPYSYNALEPYISGQIMTLHHSKHHQAYVINLNSALQTQAAATSTNDIVAQVHLQAAVRFNAGGHINHTLFWENLTPASRTTASPASSAAPNLVTALSAHWGSVEGFKARFEGTLLALQGSGWGWLVQDVETKSLEIITSKDQDIVPKGKKPLLGVDMWEHAYYLQYLNNKKDYVTGIWNVINWSTVEKRLVSNVDVVFGAVGNLAASL